MYRLGAFVSGADIYPGAQTLFHGVYFENSLADFTVGSLEAKQVQLFAKKLPDSEQFDAIVQGPQKENICKLFLEPRLSYEQQILKVKPIYLALKDIFKRASQSQSGMIITNGLADSISPIPEDLTTTREIVMYAISDALVAGCQDHGQTNNVIRRIHHDPKVPKFEIVSDLLWSFRFLTLVGGEASADSFFYEGRILNSVQVQSLVKSISNFAGPFAGHSSGGFAMLADKLQSEGAKLREIEGQLDQLHSFYLNAARGGLAILMISDHA